MATQFTLNKDEKTYTQLPDVSQPISSTDLQETPSITIPQEQPTTNFDSVIQSALEGLSSAQSQVGKTEQTQDDLSSALLRLTSDLGMESSRRRDIETEQGIKGRETALTSSINRLKSLSLQSQDLGNQFANTGIRVQEQFPGALSRNAIQARTAGEQRKIAVKQADITSQALQEAATAYAMQGDLDSARQAVTDAVNAEFEPLKNQLAVIKEAYTINKDALERIDKKKADNLNILLSERTRILNQRQSERQTTLQMSLDAAKSGASSDVVRKMQETTPEEAIAIGAQFFGEEFKRKAEQQAFENGIMTQELGLKQAEFALKKRALLLESANSGDVNAIKELGYDPRDRKLSYDELKSFETQKINIEKDIGDIQNALKNQVGLDAASGLVRGQKGVFTAIAGQSGTPFGVLAAPYVASKRNSFVATARYVVNNLRLEKVGELAAAGIKLNPISEKEIKLMGEASKRLASIGDYDDNGTLTGFIVSPKEVTIEMTSVLEHYQKALDEINVSMTLTKAEKDEIANR